MLSQCITFPVDELYLNCLGEGRVSRIGVNQGVIVEPVFADPKTLIPKTHLRILANINNLPLILSAENTYGIPVEVAPFPFLPEGVTSVRDVIVKSRNWHRSMPDHYPLRYRVVSEKDMYSFGLSYNLLTRKLGVSLYKFHEDDLDFKLNEKYIEEALEQHAMSDTFACEHVVDFCAILLDPRFHLGPGGRFNYPLVPRLLGFGSIELACQLTRKFIELHGSDPLPCDGSAMRQLHQKVTGRSEPLVPTQLLGSRILHHILASPMDNLNINLERTKCSTRLARDAEIVKQQLHYVINLWLSRLYKDDWVMDEYAPNEFDEPQEKEGD